MKRENTENDEAGRVERSGYPYMGLKPAFKVSDAMKNLGGARSEVQKNVLAHELGEKEKSPSFGQRISSAKTFGLVEGRGSYMLTELARQYYLPTSETEKRQALIRIVSAPECFGKLIQRFDGDKVPDRAMIGNLLHREFGVPGSWQDRVAGFFLGALEVAGVLDSHGILRYGTSQSGGVGRLTPTLIDEMTAPGNPRSEASQPSATNGSATTPTLAGTDVWKFTHKGKTVRLETPSDLEQPLWEKLNAYVQLLKPTEGKDE